MFDVRPAMIFDTRFTFSSVYVAIFSRVYSLVNKGSVVGDFHIPNIICLFGGPRCGKTTTLVWLYAQYLKPGSKYQPVVGDLDRTLTFSKKPTENSVLLMDLSNPSIIGSKDL